MNYKKFYMVYVQDKNVPSKIHESYDLVLKEAERLANKEKRNTYILETSKIIDSKTFEVVDVK